MIPLAIWIVICFDVVMFLLSLTSVRWEKCKGKVTLFQSIAFDVQSNQRVGLISARYRYEVAGRVYVGWRIGFCQPRIRQFEAAIDAESLIKVHRGEEVEVELDIFYFSGMARLSVLNPGVSWIGILERIARILVFAVIGALLSRACVL